MPQHVSDTIQTTSNLSEPVLVGGTNWLAALVQNYIWQEPKAIGFMLIAYHIALLSELYLVYKANKFSWRLAGRKALKTEGNTMGAMVLLYLATNTAKYNSLFLWLPQAVFAVLLSALIIMILKYFSKIGIISPLVYKVIESKISTQLQKDESNSIQSPAGDVEAGLVEPEAEVKN